MFLVSTWYGAFLVDFKPSRTEAKNKEELILRAQRPFPAKLPLLASYHKERGQGRILEIERDLVREALDQQQEKNAEDGGALGIFSYEPRLANLQGVKFQNDTTLSRHVLEHFFKKFQPSYFKFSKEFHKDFLSALAKEKMGQEKDLASQRVCFLLSSRDKLDQTKNLLKEQFHDFLSLKLGRSLSRKELRLKLQTILGARETKTQPGAAGVLAAQLEDEESLLAIARLMVQLEEQQNDLDSRLEEECKKLMPNSFSLVGHLVTARLLAAAGSLRELARLPASTIQTLGAEKALFMHLRDGTPPPKHGILFQHRHLHSVPRAQRGKVARLLAGKLSIATKIDFFSGIYKADPLLLDLEKKLLRLRDEKPKKKRREGR